jgi:hypothetical protein
MHGEPVQKSRAWAGICGKQGRIKANFNEQSNRWYFVQFNDSTFNINPTVGRSLGVFDIFNND